MRRDPFAPTLWDGDDDMEDDMGNLPKERRIGPAHVVSDMDEEMPPLPGQREEREPLPFARAPLPKDKEERSRELRDRRRREVEELTEQITDEKYSDMLKRIQGMEDKMERMEAGFKGAASSPGAVAPSPELDSLRSEVESMKQGVDDANARIDSLEEVVKGSLQPMVESIKKFSHAVKSAKQPMIPMPSMPQAPQEQPAQAKPQEPQIPPSKEPSAVQEGPVPGPAAKEPQQKPPSRPWENE
jgi:hypothetical protein